MKPDPALTIVTLSYRDPQGLEATLASLKPLHESGISWEHVVIDSSPDLNQAILEKLPFGWPLVHLREPARGIYPAMNAGIRAAQGQVLWFLNGGDLLHNIKVLQHHLDAMLGDPSLDMVCLGVRRIRDGKVRSPGRPRRVFVWNLLGGCRIPHQGVLYRTTVFNRVGNFSELYRITGDYEHHLRCYRQGMRVRCSGELLADFVLGGASDRFDATLAEWEKAATEQLSDLPDRSLYGMHRFLFKVERLRLKCVTRLRGGKW